MYNAQMRYYLLTMLLILLCQQTLAAVFSLPSGAYPVVGQIKIIKARSYDTLFSIAKRYDIGNDAIETANPQLPYGKKIGKGRSVIIPSAYILPDDSRQGIVIDLSQKLLFFYPKDQQQVYVFPIGIGKEGYATPTGEMHVIGRKQDPVWTPPPSVREAALKRGVKLPEKVPAGPHNPLGPYVIYTNKHGYWIHGTLEPHSVGRRASFGCIRMYSDDIEQLFNMVHRGVPLQIIPETYMLP